MRELLSTGEASWATTKSVGMWDNPQVEGTQPHSAADTITVVVAGGKRLPAAGCLVQESAPESLPLIVLPYTLLRCPSADRYAARHGSFRIGGSGAR
jgi:hypothetical protein